MANATAADDDRKLPAAPSTEQPLASPTKPPAPQPLTPWRRPPPKQARRPAAEIKAEVKRL